VVAANATIARGADLVNMDNISLGQHAERPPTSVQNGHRHRKKFRYPITIKGQRQDPAVPINSLIANRNRKDAIR
jgi:hypothetical protein